MWACNGCGFEYRIQPRLCTRCQITGYTPGFVQVPLPPLEQLAQAIVDGRLRVYLGDNKSLPIYIEEKELG